MDFEDFDRMFSAYQRKEVWNIEQIKFLEQWSTVRCRVIYKVRWNFDLRCIHMTLSKNGLNWQNFLADKLQELIREFKQPRRRPQRPQRERYKTISFNG